MKARKTCFISFIKLLFSVLTKRKTIYKARTINSYNSEPQTTTLLTSFSCFAALWKHTCWPIKTNVLSKLFYKQHQWRLLLSLCFVLIFLHNWLSMTALIAALFHFCTCSLKFYNLFILSTILSHFCIFNHTFEKGRSTRCRKFMVPKYF